MLTGKFCVVSSEGRDINGLMAGIIKLYYKKYTNVPDIKPIVIDGGDAFREHNAQIFNQKIDAIIFYSYEFVGYDPLELIRMVRGKGFGGMFAVWSASIHSLQKMAANYPLPEVVDLVFRAPININDKLTDCINEAMIRSIIRKEGIKKLPPAIWLSSSVVEDVIASGFKVVDD